MTAYNDNLRRATYREDTLAHDSLIAGPRVIEVEKFTLASGVVSRGAVLGRVAGAATAAAFASNTGNGTISAVTVGAGVKAGVYKVIIIEPGTNLGTFAVEDPDGVIVGRGAVGTAFAGPINFTISDGATDFIAGDGFNVTVAEGTTVKLAVLAATDGSHLPMAIAAQDADASVAPVEILAYRYGDFNERALSFGTGHTKDTVRAPLRALGIHLVATLPN
jgi:hypothetical protein